jgi:PAS domain S-box-containing protein
MKDSKNKNGARVPDLPPPVENDDPNGRWSIEERDQLLLREREARLEAEVMRDANLALTQDLSLERILETLLDYLRKLVPFDSASVMLVEGDSCFVTSAIKGYEDFLDDISLAKGNSYSPKTNALLRQICETKQSLLVSDTKDEPRWQSIPGSEHIRNWMGVPLFAHDEIMGLYSLDMAHPGYFTAEHVRKAESLAAQAATAIRNAQLFGRVDRYAAELEQLVAERKRAEEALRESEQLSRSVFEHIDEIVYMVSAGSEDPARGIVQFVSGRVEQIIGYKPDEFMNDPELWFNVLHPDDVPGVVDSTRKIFQEKRSLTRVYRVRHKHTGQYRWMEDLVVPRLDEAGTVAATFGVARDITDQKRAEEALRASEKRFRTLIENSSDAIVLLDADGIIIDHAPRTGRVMGYANESLVGRDVLEMIHPEDRALVRQVLNEVLAGEAQKITLQFRALHRNGSSRWGEGVAANHLGDPEVRAIVVNYRDITERKQAEETLRQAEQKYRDIFENAGEGISQSTPDGRFIAANPALARIYGFDSPEELISSLKDISRQVYVDPARREEFKSLLKEHGVVRGFEYQIFRKDGSKIWVSVNARAVRDERGTILYYEGTAQDINERKRAEARSAAFAALARKLSGARTQLDAGRIIAQTADDLFGWDSCDLNHYDADRDLVYQMLNIDIIDGQRTEVFGVVSGRKPTARGRRVIDHGPELRLREEPVQFDADAIPYGDRTRPSASIMIVPIRHANRVIGLLSIQSYTPHSYDSGTLDDLQALADHCGEALNRIRAEQSLTESEERFRQMAENVEDVIWIADRNISKILYVNPAYEKVFGRSCESLYERLTSFGEAVHPDDRARMERMLERQRDGDLAPVEYRIVHPDGSVRWIQRRSFPIRNNEGEVYRVAGIAQDITERKRAEHALQESEERFRQLSEAPFEAIILHDQGTILEVNQSFCQMYGYERAEVIGKSVLDLTLPELREPLRQRVRSGGAGSYDGLALRKDGTIFRAELAGKPIHYQGRFVRVAAIRDITEQRRNEQRQAAQYSVTRVLAESATVAEATPQLLQVICESLRWKMGEFWRVCDGTNVLRCAETWHVPAFDATSFIEASRQIEFAPGDGLPGRVWQSGQPAWIPDVETDPRFAHAAIAAEVGLRGAVAFPVLVGNHTLGVMLFFSRRDPEVDAELLKIMAAIGSQIGQFTERKRAEEALKQSAQDFRDLFEQAHDALIVFNPEPEIVLDVNQRACEIYGFTRSEFIGMSLEAISKDVVRGKSQVRKTLERGDYLNFETVQYRKDGSEMFLEINASTILYQGQLVILTINRDVTERKRAEEKVQSLARFPSENPSPVLRLSRDGMILHANSASRLFLQDWGCAVGDRAPLFWQQEASESLVSQTDRMIDVVCGDRTFSISVVPIVEADYVNLYGLDITERNQIEEELRESEERYRDLVENSREFICTHDLDGVILSANRAAVEVLGYDPKDYAGKKSFRDLLAPEVRDQFDDYLTRIQRDGCASGLTLVQTSSGKRRVWEYHNTLRTEGVPTPIVRGMANDITERREAEQALGVSEQKYRDIFRFAPVGICQTLRDGTLITANKALATMLGYDSVDELLSLKLDSDIYFLAGEREKVITTYENRGYTLDLELQWKRKDGSPFWIQLNAHTIQSHDGVREYYEGFVLDITERKRSEESLRKQNEYLAALHETALGLINRLDLKELLEVIVSRACALVGMPGGYVYLLEPGGNEMSVKVGVGVSRDFVGARISKGQGVAGTIWETGQPLVVEDYRNWGHRLPNAGYDALRLVGAVPLRSGSRVVGVLGVESSEEGQGLDKHQIETLNRFGQLVSIALDNAQLHSAAQQELAERKRTEEEVSKLRGELELTMNSMEEGIHRVDMKGNITFENPAAARMLGWEVDELLGKPAHQTMHHTTQDGTPYPREECPIYATLRDGLTRHVADEVFWRRDGTSFPVEYMTAPMRNDRNEIVATVVTFRDITDRKRAEDTLRESEERYGSLFVNMLNGFAYCKVLFEHEQAQDFIYLEVNDAFEKLTGFKDVVGKKVTEIIPGIRESDPELFETYGRVALTGRPETFEIYLASLDTWHAVSLYSPRKGYFVSVFDVITERKRAEAALRESEERYRELFENAKDAIYVHDLSGRYTSINRAAEQLSGYAREEILGKHFSNFVAPRDLKEVRTNLCRKLDDENETVYEVNVVTRAGQRVPVEISSRLIYENGVAVGIQGTARDITDRKRAQEALRIYSQRLIQAQEAEREKIARELHDQIGQILTAVRINLQSIQRSYGSDENIPRFDESIAIVDEALGRVRELSLELRPSLLDDLGLTAALRWYVDHFAQRTGIIAEVLNGSKEDGRLPRELETACFRIAQEALTNVARHAKASSVSVQLDHGREKMLLTIIDDGVGFDIDNLRKNMLAASALGLRGMEERALAAGGYIKIDSGAGRGTRVRATFPFRQR